MTAKSRARGAATSTTTPPWSSSSAVDAATFYASQLGWRVGKAAHLIKRAGQWICSCERGAACPVPGEHWTWVMKDLPTNDLATLLAWFDEEPNMNIAVAMGSPSGIAGIEYSADMPVALRPLLDALLVDSPPTIISDAPHAGLALFRRPPGHIVDWVELAPGLRFLGDGGHRTVPPSVTPHGKLRWIGDPSYLTPLPLDVDAMVSFARDLLARSATSVPVTRSIEASHTPEGATPAVDRNAASAPRPLPLLRVGDRMPIIIRMSDVAPLDVEWLWPGFVPFGAITVIQSDPGRGKSTVTIDITARVTTGAAAPLEDEPLAAGTALLIGREDGIAHTVRPRLDAAGADAARVLNLSDVLDDDIERPLSLPVDIKLLEAVCSKHDVRLVVIDPIVAYLGDGQHSLSDHGIRRALDPLAQLAQRLDIAVILVRHLVKRGAGPKMHHGSGSIGLAAVARSVLHIDEHPDGAVITSVKSSLGPRPDPVLFRLEPVGHHARVEWLGTVEATVTETRPPTKLERAKQLLSELLADGPLPRVEIQRRGDEEGISLRTLEEAKKALGIVAERKGRTWKWRVRNPASAIDERGVADFADAADEEV